MKRIAFLSPLPPEASGIADYSAELLPALGRRFEIDCYAGGGGGRHYSAFPAANRLHPYDAVVYQLGNNVKYHWDIYRHLLQVPGIVVLHEYMLHHLIRGGSSQAEYIETMRYCYGDAGVTAAHRLLEPHDPQEEWTYPLFEQAIDASVGVIVHSETTRGRILLSRPAARVSVVPVPAPAVDTPRASVAALNTLRRELRIDSDAFVVGSFGHVTPAKRFDVMLRAFQRLRQRYASAVYVVAGELLPHYLDVKEMLEGLLGEGVRVLGRVTLSRLHELMDLVDVAINLRHPVGGETSGTCVRLLSLGKPVVVTANGWFSEIPDGCCARIAPDRFEENELTAILEALAGDPALRRDMGTAAACWANDWHRPDRAADGYADFIEQVARERPSPPARLFPIVSTSRENIRTAMVLDVASTAADLGVPDDDERLLPILARTLVDLGM